MSLLSGSEMNNIRKHLKDDEEIMHILKGKVPVFSSGFFRNNTCLLIATNFRLLTSFKPFTRVTFHDFEDIRVEYNSRNKREIKIYKKNNQLKIFNLKRGSGLEGFIHYLDSQESNTLASGDDWDALVEEGRKNHTKFLDDNWDWLVDEDDNNESSVIMPMPVNGEPTLDPVRFFEEPLRSTILEKDDYRCRICRTTERLEIDHILPHSQRGRTVLENGQTLCHWCNQSKGVQRQEEWERTKAFKKRLNMRPQFDPAYRKNEGKLSVKQWKRGTGHMIYFYDGNEKVGEHNVNKRSTKVINEFWEENIHQVVSLYQEKFPQQY